VPRRASLRSGAAANAREASWPTTAPSALACPSRSVSSPFGYKLDESRSETDYARRCIDLDDTQPLGLAPVAPHATS
jgi:hypothetical protein